MILLTVIQQRVKESVLQAQAQQIQAALPTLLAAQALIYQQHQQQQGQITPSPQQTQPILPSHITHPGTKFNNCPLVKFPTVRPTNPSLSSGRNKYQLLQTQSSTTNFLYIDNQVLTFHNHVQQQSYQRINKFKKLSEEFH